MENPDYAQNPLLGLARVKECKRLVSTVRSGLQVRPVQAIEEIAISLKYCFFLSVLGPIWAWVFDVKAALKELLLSPINRSYLTAKTFFVCFVMLVCMAPVLASAQGRHPDGGASVVFLPNQEVSVANLPLLTAASPDASAVLATALETILPDRDVCCGKDSGLKTLFSRLRRP